MELQLVDVQTAKLAKELGFDWKCSWIIDERETSSHFLLIHKCKFQNIERDTYNIARPEQELLAKWLRDVYKIYVRVWTPSDNLLLFESYVQEVPYLSVSEMNFVKRNNSYEVVLEAGLLVALKILKERLANPIKKP